MPLDPSKLAKAAKLTHKLNSLEKLLLKENRGDARTIRIIQTLYEQEQVGLISAGERRAKLNSLTKYSKEQARLPKKEISGIRHVSVEEATGRGFKKVEDAPKNIDVKEIAPNDLDPAILARFKKIGTAKQKSSYNLMQMQGRDITDARAEGKVMYLNIEDAKKLWSENMTMDDLVSGAPPGDPKGTERLYRDRPERIDKLAEQIKQEGVQKPIELGVFGGNVTIADGHHRITALEKLGETKVPIQVDEDFVGSGLHQKLLKQLGGE